MLKYKVIWLTGASTGIGRALALKLLREGNNVIVSARNLDALNDIAGQFPEQCLPIALDVTDAESVASAAEQIQAKYDKLDMLVANAGTCEYVDIDDIDVDLIRRVMETNFFGVVNVVKAALPSLRKATEAHIAIMSSSSTYLAFPRAEAYGASKAAINYFSESLRVDLASEDISVAIISPGFVETPLTDKNDFPMPAIVSVERAADDIFEGLRRKDLEIHFPKRFTLTLKMLAHLPKRLQFGLAKKLSRNQLPAN